MANLGTDQPGAATDIQNIQIGRARVLPQPLCYQLMAKIDTFLVPKSRTHIVHIQQLGLWCSFRSACQTQMRQKHSDAPGILRIMFQTAMEMERRLARSPKSLQRIPRL